MGRGRPRWPLPKCRGISALCCGDWCVWVDWCGHCAPDAGCVILCVGSAVCARSAPRRPTPTRERDEVARVTRVDAPKTRLCLSSHVCVHGDIGVCETLSLC